MHFYFDPLLKVWSIFCWQISNIWVINVANDCLGNRQRRIDTDLVQDNTENQILKELETISGVKATLTECLRNARDQLTASREAKHNLEMDWSDKVTS